MVYAIGPPKSIMPKFSAQTDKCATCGKYTCMNSVPFLRLPQYLAFFWKEQFIPEKALLKMRLKNSDFPAD